MWKKIAVLSVNVVIVLVVISLTAFTGHGRKNVPVNWHIAGSVVNPVEMTDMATQSTVPVTLINLSAKGSPGKAQIQVAGTSVPAASPSGLCPEGTGLELEFEGSFVATFSDLSLLVAAIQIDGDPNTKNALCINFATGQTKGIFDYAVTGGTGRFEGATGALEVNLDAWPAGAFQAAEDGQITGMIHLP